MFFDFSTSFASYIMFDWDFWHIYVCIRSTHDRADVFPVPH